MPNFGQGSGPKKCIRCLRTKKEAIRAHLETMQPCDNEDCPFYNDILEAIEKKRNRPKFNFGTPQKKESPRINFGQPIKSDK